MNKKTKTRLVVGLTIVIVITLTILLSKDDKKENQGGKKPILDENAVDISPSPEKTVKESRSIKIPVEDKLTFSADTKMQEVSFVNPNENNCLFIVTLTLSNKEIIYKSNQIPPGKAIYKIEIKTKLEKGEYKDAILTYHCIKEDGTPLNNAEFKVDIVVE